MTLLTPAKRGVFLRFGAVMAAGNLIWEFAHVPLYTLWQSGTWAEIIYAVIHCTIGDLMIAATCLAAALALFGRHNWPARAYLKVALTTMILALGYTLFSEWLNTEVRMSWAYGPLMPRLPPFGTGLTPVLQWILVPALAFWLASPRVS